MKKIFMILLVFLVSFTSIAPVLSVSAVESSTNSLASYKSTVRSIVDKYVKNLDDQNFTDDQIVNSLTKLRDSYQKLLSTSRGTKKAKIQIIVNTINQKIDEVKNRDDMSDDDLYNLFNQAPVTTTTTTTNNYYNATPSCTKELKMCSNGSSVSRSWPSCSFAECPAVVVPPTPTTNNIISANSYIINWVLRTDLKSQNPNTFYKKYDVYLYTPSAMPWQPSYYAELRAGKPENLMYNYYNNYTMTTTFQRETELSKVKNIRSIAETSPYIFSISKTLTKDTAYVVDGFLSDKDFAERASKSDWVNWERVTNGGVYSTYYLYLAQDNSEAFILLNTQSGRKKNGIVYVSMDIPAQSQYVPKNLGRWKIATIKLTAGNNDASISSLKIKRSGLWDPREVLLISANTPWNWTNGNVFDSFDATTQEGTINFATPIYIKANESVTLEIVASLSSVNGNTQHIFTLISVETPGTITWIPITLWTLNTTTASTY